MLFLLPFSHFTRTVNFQNNMSVLEKHTNTNPLKPSPILEATKRRHDQQQIFPHNLLRSSLLIICPWQQISRRVLSALPVFPLKLFPLSSIAKQRQIANIFLESAFWQDLIYCGSSLCKKFFFPIFHSKLHHNNQFNLRTVLSGQTCHKYLEVLRQTL